MSDASSRRPASPRRRLAAGIAVVLAGAIVACGPSESARSSAAQSGSAQSGAAAFSSLTLDVDGDGKVTSYGDAMLIMRYTSGFRGKSLIEGVVSSDCGRCTAEQIEQYISSL